MRFRQTIKKFFLNPYTIEILVGILVGGLVGVGIAFFSTDLAIKRQRDKEAKDQRTEAMHALENIASEMDYNIQKIDDLIRMLETVRQDSFFITKDLWLSESSFKAALTTGQLRHIPKFALALSVCYEEVERFNKRLDDILHAIYFSPSLNSTETENLMRYVKNTVRVLENLKKALSGAKSYIYKDKSLIVEDKLWVEIKRQKEETIIIYHKHR